MADTKLSVQSRWLFALLSTYANQQDLCWPSIRTLAEAAGASVRTVQRWMHELELAGWVVRHGDAGAGEVLRTGALGKCCTYLLIRDAGVLISGQANPAKPEVIRKQPKTGDTHVTGG